MRHTGLMLVFVYGTLMRGGCRAGHLSGQRFVGEAVTEPRYRMFDCGSYPGLVEHPRGRSITGEIWEVGAECLWRLDQIERVVEGLYERRPIRLRPPFADQSINAYYYLQPTVGMRDCGVKWANDAT